MIKSDSTHWDHTVDLLVVGKLVCGLVQGTPP